MTLTLTLSLAHRSEALALELHRLLRDLDPATFRADMQAALHERVQSLLTELHALLESNPRERAAAALRQRLQDLARYLDERTPRPGAPDLRAEWQRFRDQAQPLYESLASRLRAERIHVPSLRPTNYSRNAFHVANALVALVMIEVVLGPVGLMAAACGFAGFAWFSEIARRRSPRYQAWMMRLFGKVAHPHEEFRVNSATWYASALVLLAATWSTGACAVGVIVLGLADPAAAIIGRRFGRVRLYNGRSLEGSLTFLLVGWAAAFGVLLAWHPYSMGWSAALALGGALPAMFAELFSNRIDDNFTIPVAAAAGFLGTLALLV